MAHKTHYRCGRLYIGKGKEVLKDQTIVVEGGMIVDVAATASINKADGVEEVDLTKLFVMPGLVDVHTHLSYGNAKTEEDIDLYASLEFRALRGMYFAHQVLAAGVTSINAPGGAGNVNTSIRDAIDAGLFEGPRLTAAGPYITSRQGLTDWYPTWIGAPVTSIGRLVKSKYEAIEEIRRQAKDGVDVIKIAMDGLQRRPDGEYIAAFTLDEAKAMISEVKRLGKIAITHARGREATLYSAQAGADLIFHASYMDDEALEAVVKSGSLISPTLLLLRNTLDFVLNSSAAYGSSRRMIYQTEFDAAVVSLNKARKAGVQLPVGTDSGFAITPFGEWHARELEIYVNYLGFSPIEALEAGTSTSAKLLRPADQNVGTIAKGFKADIIGVYGDPTKDITDLLKKDKIQVVIKGGQPITQPRRGYDPKKVSDFAMTMFTDHYTRDRVKELHNLY